MNNIRLPEHKVSIIAGFFQGKFALTALKTEVSDGFLQSINLDEIVQRMGYKNKEAFFLSEYYLKAFKEHLITDGPTTFYTLFTLELTETFITTMS